MEMTTISSRAFNQGTCAAKCAARNGPVVITDRGQPVHVLISFEDYQRLIKSRHSIADALAMSDSADIDFEPPRATISMRPLDL